MFKFSFADVQNQVNIPYFMQRVWISLNGIVVGATSDLLAKSIIGMGWSLGRVTFDLRSVTH